MRTLRPARATTLARRISRGLAPFASAIAVLPAPLSAQGAPGPPVFATGVEVVAVDLSVVDRDGRPMRGLGPGDFTLKVGGRLRRIVSVQFVSEGVEEATEGPEAPPEPPSSEYSTNEHARPGRLILVAVDQNNISMGGGREAIAAVDKLLSRLTPADRVGLLTVPTSGPRVEFTTDHAAVREAMRSLVGRGRLAGRHVSLTEALAYVRGDDPDKWKEAHRRECGGDPPSKSGFDPCLEELKRDAETVALDYHERSKTALNVLRSLFETLKTIDAPKTVVLITQGLGEPDSGSRAGLGFASEIRPLGEAAAAARVSLFAVRVSGGLVSADDTLGQTAAQDDQLLHEYGLETLASVARGVVLRGFPEQAFERIAREISGHYLLGFEAEAAERDGKRHGLKVSVNRPGVTVRTWSAVDIARPSTPKDDERALVASLRSPQAPAAVPVRVATYSLPDQASRKVRVLLSAELGGEGPKEGMSVAYALVDGRDRVVASASQRAKDAEGGGGRVPFVTSLLVEPGHYTLKLAARERTGRIGRVDHPVKAELTSAPGSGEIDTGDLVIGPLPSPGTGFRAAAGPDIAGPAVVARWDVCPRGAGPFDGATAVAEIVSDEMGPVLRSVPAHIAATEAGSVVQAVLPLVELVPGRYVIRVSLAFPGRPPLTATHTLRLGGAGS